MGARCVSYGEVVFCKWYWELVSMRRVCGRYSGAIFKTSVKKEGETIIIGGFYYKSIIIR